MNIFGSPKSSRKDEAERKLSRGDLSETSPNLNRRAKLERVTAAGLFTSDNSSDQRSSFTDTCQPMTIVLKTMLLASARLRSQLNKTLDESYKADSSKKLSLGLQKHKEFPRVAVGDMLRLTRKLLSCMHLISDGQEVLEKILKAMNTLVSGISHLQHEQVLDSRFSLQVNQKALLDFQTSVLHLFKSFMQAIKQIVASHACTVFQDTVPSLRKNSDQSQVILIKKAQTLQILSDLQSYISDSQTVEAIPLVSGYVWKWKGNDSAFGKPWKKKYVVLYQGKLVLTDKENDSKNVKTLLTNEFTNLSDVSEELKKQFCFRITGGERPITFCCGSDEEFQKWTKHIRQIIHLYTSTVAFTESEMDYTTFDETELKQVLKAYDREAKYAIEITRLNYLQKMANILMMASNTTLVSAMRNTVKPAVDAKQKKFSM